MNSRILSFITALVLSVPPAIRAQTDYGETFKSRLYTGADFQVGFGYVSLIDISPLVGYNVNRYVSGGLGFTYMFFSDNTVNPAYRTNLYGGRVFTRLVPLPDALPGIFFHAGIESINNKQLVAKDPFSPAVLRRVWTPSFMGGIGFRQRAGENSFFTITLLYNFLDDGTYGKSIYAGPLIYRIGFIYGLY